MTRGGEIPEAAAAFGPNERMPLPVEWSRTFTDTRLAAAVIDRITYRAHIIETGSTSYRLASATNRK